MSSSSIEHNLHTHKKSSNDFRLSSVSSSSFEVKSPFGLQNNHPYNKYRNYSKDDGDESSVVENDSPPKKAKGLEFKNSDQEGLKKKKNEGLKQVSSNEQPGRSKNIFQNKRGKQQNRHESQILDRLQANNIMLDSNGLNKRKIDFGNGSEVFQINQSIQSGKEWYQKVNLGNDSQRENQIASMSTSIANVNGTYRKKELVINVEDIQQTQKYHSQKNSPSFQAKDFVKAHNSQDLYNLKDNIKFNINKNALDFNKNSSQSNSQNENDSDSILLSTLKKDQSFKMLSDDYPQLSKIKLAKIYIQNHKDMMITVKVLYSQYGLLPDEAPINQIDQQQSELSHYDNDNLKQFNNHLLFGGGQANNQRKQESEQEIVIIDNADGNSNDSDSIRMYTSDGEEQKMREIEKGTVSFSQSHSSKHHKKQLSVFDQLSKMQDMSLISVPKPSFDNQQAKTQRDGQQRPQENKLSQKQQFPKLNHKSMIEDLESPKNEENPEITLQNNQRQNLKPNSKNGTILQQIQNVRMKNQQDTNEQNNKEKHISSQNACCFSFSKRNKSESVLKRKLTHEKQNFLKRYI